jgi:hypothetical protein
MRIIPLKGKKPATMGSWKSEPFLDPRDVPGRIAFFLNKGLNWGHIPADSNIIVVDIDDKTHTGQVPFDKEDLVTVISTPHGKHLVFTNPEKYKHYKRNNPWGEVIYDKGYIVGVGSTIDGAKYLMSWVKK